MHKRRRTYQPSDVPTTRYQTRWDRIVGATGVGLVTAGMLAIAWHAIPVEEARADTSGGIGMCSAAFSESCAGSDHETGRVAERIADAERAAAHETAPVESEPEPAAEADAAPVDASQGGTPDVVKPADVEPAPLAGNGTLDDGETADGPVTEYDEATLICGTKATVAIDVDIHGNEWAYCEPR